VLFNLQNTPPAAFHASRTPKQPKEEKNGKLTKKKKEKGGKQEAKKKKKIDRKGKWMQEVYLALWNRTSMG